MKSSVKKLESCLHDAQAMLSKIIDENLLTARGIYGFWPANSEGDSIILYTDRNTIQRTDSLSHAATAVAAERF